jgi:hypothetical protein
MYYKTMRLNKENITQILSKNFNFDKIDDPYLGTIVKVSAFDAFIYSSVTGHGYLDNTSQPYTPNGLMQIFNQANAYNFVTGMFDRDGNLFHSPLYEVKNHPYLSDGDKFIVPIEYETNANLQEKLFETKKHIVRSGREPKDFIICRIKTTTAGFSMEPFMEYVTSKYFNKRGYFTETQIPFYYSGGTPDFAAYVLPNIGNIVKKHFGFMGSSFIGLASIRAFGLHENNGERQIETEAIVGEVKTASLQALDQIRKYLDKGIFNRAYEIIPNKKTPETIAGLITLDDEGEIKIYEAKTAAKVIPEKQSEYLAWLQNYIKYFLIANLTNEELDEFYSQKSGKRTKTVHELLAFINALHIENILDALAKYIHGKQI